MEEIYASVILIPIVHFNFVTIMLFVVYKYNFIIKFVLILSVFYYYVTPNFFYSPPTFGSPCIITILSYDGKYFERLNVIE